MIMSSNPFKKLFHFVYLSLNYYFFQSKTFKAYYVKPIFSKALCESPQKPRHPNDREKLPENSNK